MIELRTKQLLTPSHAAVRLKLSVRRVLQLADAGILDAVIDSGGSRTFPIEVVERERQRRERKAK